MYSSHELQSFDHLIISSVMLLLSFTREELASGVVSMRYDLTSVSL